MSVVVRIALGAALVAGYAAPAHAQEDDRFFDEKVEEKADDDEGARAKKKSLVQGSLTSTSFLYRETAPIADELSGGQVGVDNASPINRLFTDLRGQIRAKHISGGNYDGHIDARARVTPDDRFQSGTFSGSEYEIREMYLLRNGVKTDATIGRQYVFDLAATKIDGVKIEHRSSPKWKYILFAGLYPSRVSRSIETDYPKGLDDMGMPGAGGRVLPIAGGLGGAYRLQKYYGSLGVVGILPNANEQAAGAPRAEKTRVFGVAQGYWRQSRKLDVYHFLVADAQGSGGSGLTNLSLGLNYKPTFNMRITAAVNRVDTETLNVIAQNQLEDPDPEANAKVLNNIQVARIASDSARLGISVGLKQRRFEVSVSGLLRRRPEIVLLQSDYDAVNNPGAVVTIPAAQAAEITLAVTDRRSFRGHRIGVSTTSIFGYGDTNLYRTDASIYRAYASRPFKDGAAEYELDVSYVLSKDNGRETPCSGVAAFQDCFGTSKVNTYSLGALLFYRLKHNWLLIGSGRASSQGITIIDNMTEVPQPRITILSAFLRLAYRF